ncbi:copper resistance system multicopper oxidase [Sphingoaurantiacus capsulatus]|uniref:Copper resistance system multicopper oxidase n=1 Tax=Sphingoaurantiacus capsulatus TaxID=1771310 RepID=A0ABV7XEH8_9SPHN
MNHPLPRRALLRAGLSGAAALGAAGLFPAWARSGTPGLPPVLSGEEITLRVAHGHFSTGGRSAHAITMNGVLPAPLVRLREGQNVRIHVDNALDEDTSIHWHGLILPFHMDGVPGISFPGIRPHSRFTYEFPIKQFGTYWYHSHSGLQEQMGHYGPLVIDPAGAEPAPYDREHVIVLSDWTFEHPHKLFLKVKQKGGYFNRRKQVFGDGAMSPSEKLMWGEMRMDPTDIADINGTTYSFLLNGHGPAENWTGLFKPGERVRLRFINASAMTIFNVRIPGLPMTIVQADGTHVRPVETDEFQISVAETYDAIVTPTADQAYTLMAEAIDRSGYVRGTLAPQLGMTAAVPVLRERPTLSMRDMGMAHGSGEDESCAPEHAAMGHCTPGAPAALMDHSMRDTSLLPDTVKVGVGVDMVAPMPADRTGDRPLGLEKVPHRVLTYHQLAPLVPFPDTRPPARQVDIHLTGNMERFMWSFDGRKMNEGVEPIRFELNERVRVNLINNSMMNHPIHIHGHFFELVTGQAHGHPVKHTVNVMPGGKASFDLTADAPGDWAFHCHLLFHMHAGMMNVVKVRPMAGGAQ